eukprot:m.5742 g.5742  ORF g.5742 m.5742 type:complete len:508 (+) comp5083_c0_seq1:228-1751(+)
MAEEQVFQEKFEKTPIIVAVITYISYAILYAFGHLRDAMRKYSLEKSKTPKELDRMMDFPTLYNDFSDFFTRNLYRRIRDCWNRPICSVPGDTFKLVERTSDDYGWTFHETGEEKEYINLGSYNYLGFAENKGPCADQSIEAIKKYGVTCSSPRAEAGTLDIHVELETLVAEFVGKESALVFGMGFATNSTNIPVLVGKGCLIVSDEMNHTSVVLGARLSGANIKTFRHNDLEHLEQILRASVIEGQPRTNRPWKKILIIVEGVYSMEGSLANLPGIIALKKKYKAYIYLDEAHSIGALGPNGRGVVEHFGLDPKDIDIMMGTFTKSFGAAGGYIAADATIIDALRSASHGHCYAMSMSPPVAQQTLSAFRQIMGLENGDLGRQRIRRLADNAKFFREHAQAMGFIVYGNNASPVIPMMIFMPAKIAAISRMCKEQGVCVVVVGYPATPVVESRVRFCISASHTRAQLIKVLKVLDQVGDRLGLKYSKEYKPGPFRILPGYTEEGNE